MNAEPTPMGWFPVAGTSDVRWWDGTGWTPYRLRGGTPRPDAFAIEPATTGVVLGCVFILLAISQWSTYNLSGQPFFIFVSVLFVFTGIVWLIGGIQAARLKKLPRPSTVPVFAPSTRPLPGETDGPGAGWYSVTGQVSRWWTGTQWSAYVGQRLGVRPTHAGRRGYRVSMAVGWAFVGFGAVGAVVGIIMISVLGRWEGMAVLFVAAIVLIAGAFLLPLMYTRRYTMILPSRPPP
ncbi:MAG: hypothetical protein ACTIAA_13225, partial [Microbacterium sp.]